MGLHYDLKTFTMCVSLSPRFRVLGLGFVVTHWLTPTRCFQNHNLRFQLMVNGVIGPLVVWLLQAVLEDVPTAKFGEVSPSGNSFTILVPTSHRANLKSVVDKATEAFETRFFCARIDTRNSTVSANLSTKQRNRLGIIKPLIRECHLCIDGKKSSCPIIKQTKKWVISDSEDGSASAAEPDSDSDELLLGFSQTGGGTVPSRPAFISESGRESDDDPSQEDDPCRLYLCSNLPKDDIKAFAINFRKTINEVRELTAEEQAWDDILQTGEPWIDAPDKTVNNWKSTIKDMLHRIFECFSHVAVGHFVRGNDHKKLPPGIDKTKVIKLDSGDYYPRALALPHDFLDAQSKVQRQQTCLKIQSSVNLNVWESLDSRIDLAELFRAFKRIILLAKIAYRKPEKGMEEFMDPSDRECAFVPDYMLG